MNEIKKILTEEVEMVLPQNFSENIRKQVMSRILKPETKSAIIPPKASYSEVKDNIHLIIGVVFCSILIYFLGFSKSFALTITVSKDLIFSFMTKTVCGMVVIWFLVNEHFDRKKKVLI